MDTPDLTASICSLAESRSISSVGAVVFLSRVDRFQTLEFRPETHLFYYCVSWYPPVDGSDFCSLERACSSAEKCCLAGCG